MNGKTIQVPAEILALIFTYCVPTSEEFNNVLDRRQRFSWLSVTQTCRKWRAVALEHSSMWTRPDFLSPGLAQAMIDRSKSALLHIEYFDEMYWASPWSRIMLSEIFSNPSRIATIKLELNWESAVTILPKLIGPAPSLRSLGIECINQFSVPGDLLGGGAPCLTELSLHGCDLPWSSPLLGARLTSLSWGPKIGFLERPSEQQFTSVLNNLTSLETLVLEKTFPHSIKDTAHISLPQLRYLRLLTDSNGSDSIELLDALDFPDTTVIELDIACYSDTSAGRIAGFKPLFSCLARRAGPGESVNALHIDGLESFYYAELILSVWTVLPDMSALENEPKALNPVPPNPPRFRLKLRWDTRTLDELALQFKEVVSDALEALDLTCLETLSIDFQSGDSALEAIFGLLQHSRLKNLVLRGTCAYQAIPLFGGIHKKHGKGEEADRQQDTPLFCALQLISFISVDFRAFRFETMVLENLKARLEHSAPVKRLRLKRCKNLFKRDIERLSEVVEEVEWDGYEFEGSDISDGDDSCSDAEATND
uniref:F-box domain-containing protein n=1 Tax=Moniliophthora roreri TaxID=221103 RepID=A0A0W0EZR3_MONRR